MENQIFYYQIKNGTIEITGLKNRVKEIIIPNKIDGISVTHIGDWAFDGNQLTNVEIPNSVTHIGNGAFRSNQLTSVEIPNSVTHIGDWAFRYNQLTSVEIPNSVTHIGDGAFESNQLTSVEIPNSVTHIGDGAFRYNQLTSVEIPNSVTHIGDWAFRSNQLTSVEIPNSVTHIGDGAFRYNQLTSVEIPNSVTHIGDGAFDGNVDIVQSNHKIKMVDGIATIVRKSKSVEGFKTYSGKFFNSKKECFVAQKGGFSAHGNTLRQAIEDVNFKYLQENFNIDEIVKEIKEKEIISVNHFRLLTGACKAGCENFMNQKGIEATELPLKEAIPLIRNQYGWSKIEQYFINY